MLYLEDYLEMIEQLPMDLRDRFTEMREMDLQVQNAMDQLEQRVNEFFMNAKKNKPEWREEQMTSIKKDYYKALEDADEKVQLANQIYDLVDRHLRKLDQELAKFKMELEADNAGITEILERHETAVSWVLTECDKVDSVGQDALFMHSSVFSSCWCRLSVLLVQPFCSSFEVSGAGYTSTACE
ncbi:inhibitor of growth protein 3 isoform 4-T5 [Sylvia borin]